MNDGDRQCQGCKQVITASAADRVDRLRQEWESIDQRGYCIACFWERKFMNDARRIKSKRKGARL